MNEKRVYSIRPGETCTIIESAAETGDAYSRFENRFQPGVAAPPHYHMTFDEHFQVVEGELAIWEGRRKTILTAGQEAFAARNVVHRFKNESDREVICIVTMTPGQAAVEQWLEILAGLTRDGQVTAGGMPKSPYVLACLMAATNSRFSGPAAIMNPLFDWLYRRARSKGLEEQLLARYHGAQGRGSGSADGEA